MKELDPLLDQTSRQLGKPAAAGIASRKNAAASVDSKRSAQGHDHVDVINQVFAEFELAYHNQFHKAYAQEGSLVLAKKYWLECLRDFAPDVILRAVRHVVRHQEFLPTVAAVVRACEQSHALFGLPDELSAYREACQAREPRHAWPWSHPAVYHAGSMTGWFELASQPQQEILPVFSYHYTQLCRQVMQGEALSLAHPSALPASVTAPLSEAENRQRMAALKARFGLD